MMRLILKDDGRKPYRGEIPVRPFLVYRENQTFSHIHRLISQEIVRGGETIQMMSNGIGSFVMSGVWVHLSM
ncbi:hypothetical protein LCD52_22775 [Rossellomorea vietnamensis]|uniref:hypothetical protein n=1 Tax=Rossellomorea vietnamensis TaxID=218284 RepID=UPI001CCC0E57|nr:hypothetical protein [Rossellomorea vietnamensis]MCA0151533.1 hypothetical protein [Rossellomorea vietnamensis]